MLKALLRLFKQLMTYIGAVMPDKFLHYKQMILNYMKLGHWARQMGFRFPRRYQHRDQVFEVLASRIRDERVLYLEFGVFKGMTMRWWARALKNPESNLHGFDSFEGLPEDYDDIGGRYVKGWFSTGGQIPQIDDSRVKFFKGWFEDTLPGYSLPEYDVLVINLDADLYSSTIYVLRMLKDRIQAGTYIYLDDMSRPDHEPRAFEEFIAESELKFKPLAADVTLNNALFICEG